MHEVASQGRNNPHGWEYGQGCDSIEQSSGLPGERCQCENLLQLIQVDQKANLLRGNITTCRVCRQVCLYTCCSGRRLRAQLLGEVRCRQSKPGGSRQGGEDARGQAAQYSGIRRAIVHIRRAYAERVPACNALYGPILQKRQQSGPDQRRLAIAAHADYKQQTSPSTAAALLEFRIAQPPDHLADRLRAAKEYVLMLRVERLQAPKRRAAGPARAQLVLTGFLKLAQNPLAGVFGQLALKVRAVGEAVMSHDSGALGVVERRAAKLRELFVLPKLLFGVSARQIHVRWSALAIDQYIWATEFLVRRQGVLNLELGPCWRRLPRFGCEVRWQPLPQARPQDADDEVTLRRPGNLLLKARMGKHRLMLPKNRLDVQDVGKLVGKSAKHATSQCPLLGNVTGRGYENAEFQFACHSDS